VDVISDVICPWCFIGKRRLEKAVAALDGQVNGSRASLAPVRR
jgi:predicted DsbA family dithiol-disulfide isomerase